jgi:PhnB protein
MVKPIPDGYSSITPYLIFEDAKSAIDFDDVDAFTKKAVAAGAEVLRPVKNQFYGDRTGTFLDPFGYKWTIGTHVEDVPPEEMETRMASATAG